MDRALNRTKDVTGSMIALVLVWASLSFLFEYLDPVLSGDTSEQLLALNAEPVSPSVLTK